MVKQRLDVLLVERGLCSSRQLAQRLIQAGEVTVNQQVVDKPGTDVDVAAQVQVKERSRFVSRGGEKLAKALEVFAIPVEGRICLDGGISTGGFTDCLLQAGAKLVYGVDVGYGQVDWKLRNDPRVILKERTNLRNLTPDELYSASLPSEEADTEEVHHNISPPSEEADTEEVHPNISPPSKGGDTGGVHADLAVVDVSFISLTKILPALWQLTQPPREAVLLVKPQFEVGKNRVGKKGVVRDPKDHADAIFQVLQVAQELGWKYKGLTWSPVTGPAGNIEYLLWLEMESKISSPDLEMIKEITKLAVTNFGSSVLSGLNFWENAKIAKPAFQNYENF